MKPFTATVTRYEAEDGSVHDSEDACLKYEADMKNISYWEVGHSPDLTEGRGAQRTTFLKVRTPFGNQDAKMWVDDYCYRTFGRPVAFAQGQSACPNWTLQTSNVKKYNYYVNETSQRIAIQELKIGNLTNAEGYGLV